MHLLKLRRSSAYLFLSSFPSDVDENVADGMLPEVLPLQLNRMDPGGPGGDFLGGGGMIPPFDQFDQFDDFDDEGEFDDFGFDDDNDDEAFRNFRFGPQVIVPPVAPPDRHIQLELPAPQPQQQQQQPRYGLGDFVDNYNASALRSRRREFVLGAGDRVGKFDGDFQISFGRVLVDTETMDAMIEWEDGKNEELKRSSKGSIMFGSKIGVFDRDGIDVGVKVTDGPKVGHVKRKRVLVTLSLNESPNVVLDNIPAELLVRATDAKKDVKILYKDKWIGLLVGTKTKIHFKMDKDGKVGKVDQESGFGDKLIVPGQKIPRMSISSLWDADWGQNDYWFWNFLKYLADPATVIRTENSRMNIAWMGRIDKDILHEDDLTPLNELGHEFTSEVKYLYGRNEDYLIEHTNWRYTTRPEDSPLSYDQWVRHLYDTELFGAEEEQSTEEVFGPKEECLQIEEGFEYVSGKEVLVTLVLERTVFDVEWNDGTIETVPLGCLRKPDTLSIIPELKVGDLVEHNYVSNDSIKKYGYVEKFKDNWLVSVRWVLVPAGGNINAEPKVVSTDVSVFDLNKAQGFEWIDCLQDFPVVIRTPTDELVNIVEKEEVGPSFDNVKVGIPVDVRIPEAKIVVKCPDGIERLVWAHDIIHFRGDVCPTFDEDHKKSWTKWTFPKLDDDKEVDPDEMIYLPSSPKLGAYRNRNRFLLKLDYPHQNMFHLTEYIPRVQDAKFQYATTKEFEILKSEAACYGLWIESYPHRADLISITLRGQKKTMYEDFLFILDFLLPPDYPESPPKVCLNYDKTLRHPLVFPGLNEHGELELPTDLLGPAARGESQILRIIKYIREDCMVGDPMLRRQEFLDEGHEELLRYLQLSLLEYTETMLKFPIRAYSYFISSYFSFALPTIIRKHEEYLRYLKDNLGAEPESGFMLSLRSRLDNLREFVPESLSEIVNRSRFTIDEYFLDDEEEETNIELCVGVDIPL